MIWFVRPGCWTATSYTCDCWTAVSSKNTRSDQGKHCWGLRASTSKFLGCRVGEHPTGTEKPWTLFSKSAGASHAFYTCARACPPGSLSLIVVLEGGSNWFNIGCWTAARVYLTKYCWTVTWPTRAYTVWTPRAYAFWTLLNAAGQQPTRAHAFWTLLYSSQSFA